MFERDGKDISLKDVIFHQNLRVINSGGHTNMAASSLLICCSKRFKTH
jgi:hypothetical protein